MRVPMLDSWMIGKRSEILHQLAHRVTEARELAEELGNLGMCVRLRQLERDVIYERDRARDEALSLSDKASPRWL